MTCTIERFDTGMHYAQILNSKALEFLNSGHKRVIVDINKSTKLHCSLMHSNQVGYFIYLGSKVLNKLKLKESDIVTIDIQKDNSEYQFEYPEEFEEVLNTDLDAMQIFNTLTDGNKRSLIYLITRVKSVNKRIERSLKIAEHLKQGISSARKIKF